MLPRSSAGAPPRTAAASRLPRAALRPGRSSPAELAKRRSPSGAAASYTWSAADAQLARQERRQARSGRPASISSRTTSPKRRRSSWVSTRVEQVVGVVGEREVGVAGDPEHRPARRPTCRGCRQEVRGSRPRARPSLPGAAELDEPRQAVGYVTRTKRRRSSRRDRSTSMPMGERQRGRRERRCRAPARSASAAAKDSRGTARQRRAARRAAALDRGDLDHLVAQPRAELVEPQRVLGGLEPQDPLPGTRRASWRRRRRASGGRRRMRSGRRGGRPEQRRTRRGSTRRSRTASRGGAAGARIGRKLEHAGVEVDPRELTVEKPVGQRRRGHSPASRGTRAAPPREIGDGYGRALTGVAAKSRWSFVSCVSIAMTFPSTRKRRAKSDARRPLLLPTPRPLDASADRRRTDVPPDGKIAIAARL